MKKLLILLFTLSSSLLALKAQSWDPLGSGIQGNGGISAMHVYNGVLWVGGHFDSANEFPSRNIAQWDTNGWTPIPNGFNLETSSMAVYNGDLYVGGAYDSVAGISIPLLARWNGTAWDTVGRYGLGGAIVGALDTFDGELYASGWFAYADGIYVNNIASWDGTTWRALGRGVGSLSDGGPGCMCVYNGVLYVGGVFDSVDGNYSSSDFAGWNGTNWITYDSVINGGAYCMAVYKGELYMGGYFGKIGSLNVRNIAKWDGTSWSDVGGGVEYNFGDPNYRVGGMFVYNGDLYVGGHFDTAGGIPVKNIAKWDGTSWSSIDIGVWGAIGGGSDGSGAFAAYDSSLYVGGGFDTAGGMPARDIARWTTPSSINELSDDNYCKIYPNPSNGIFNLVVSKQLSVDSKIYVEVYDLFGEKVYSQSSLSELAQAGIVHYPLSIDLSSQPNGIYLCRILSKTNRLIGQSKIIIMK